MDTKQVIVVRKDLNMRKGKIAAQASHAAMSFITRFLSTEGPGLYHVDVTPHAAEADHWLNNSFRKICCYVNSEAELDEVCKKAADKGLQVHMIIDNGLTEFNGVPTKTCLAIGPHWDDKFIGVTDTLPLL